MAKRRTVFRRSLATALLCVCMAVSPSAGGDTDDVGSFSVGFRYVYKLDPERAWTPFPFDEEAPAPSTDRRPVRVAMWYPAVSTDGDLMPFRTYVAPIAPDAYFGRLNEVMTAYDLWSYDGMFGGDSTLVDRLLEMDSGARYEAEPAGGKFPVVVYSSGWYSRSPDNTAWAEYLASRGYVVATVPQLGPGVIEYDFQVTPDRVRTQTRDLEFALEILACEPFADMQHVAAAGFSIGGIAALWLQQSDPRIDVVIGLDGSFLFEDWIELTRSGLEASREPFSLLAFHRGHSKQMNNITYELIKSMDQADRYAISVDMATHGEFSDEPALFSSLGAPWIRTDFNSLEQALTAHRQVIEATHHFLDAAFSGEGDQLVTQAGPSAWPASLQLTKYPRRTSR